MSPLGVEFAPPTPADIDELVANMREQDVAEVLAAGHTDLHRVLTDSVRLSRWVLAARTPDGLMCIFGFAVVGTALAPTGVPWMLGTPLVPRYQRALARLAPHYIHRMLQVTPRLMNVVHARNTLAVRWLKRLGFQFQPTHPVGPNHEPFHVFEMTRRV